MLHVVEPRLASQSHTVECCSCMAPYLAFTFSIRGCFIMCNAVAGGKQVPAMGMKGKSGMLAAPPARERCGGWWCASRGYREGGEGQCHSTSWGRGWAPRLLARLRCHLTKRLRPGPAVRSNCKDSRQTQIIIASTWHPETPQRSCSLQWPMGGGGGAEGVGVGGWGVVDL